MVHYRRRGCNLYCNEFFSKTVPYSEAWKRQAREFGVPTIYSPLQFNLGGESGPIWYTIGTVFMFSTRQMGP